MIVIVNYDKWVKDPEFYNEPYLLEILNDYQREARYHYKRYTTLKRAENKLRELEHYHRFIGYIDQVNRLLSELKKMKN